MFDQFLWENPKFTANNLQDDLMKGGEKKMDESMRTLNKPHEKKKKKTKLLLNIYVLI